MTQRFAELRCLPNCSLPNHYACPSLEWFALPNLLQESEHLMPIGACVAPFVGIDTPLADSSCLLQEEQCLTDAAILQSCFNMLILGKGR